MKTALVALLACAAALAQPISLYPENPHYFLFGGKPTVLITSGEHYGALLNKDFNYRVYLDTLHAAHLNLTRVFSGSYREVPGNFSIASNTLAPVEESFIAPWLRKEGKFDLTQRNPDYYARLRNLVAYAGERGIVVELVLFCPLYEDSMWNVSPMNARNNVNGIGDIARADVLTLKDARLTQVQDEMVRQIVTALSDYDNVYYEICNEPYFGGVTPEWQRHISETIADTEAKFPKKHLIAQNWANGSKGIDQPNPLVSLFNFHYSRPPDSVAMNSRLNKAIGNNETGFDGPADATYRIQGWDFLMAGGALYNNLDYSFTVGHEDGAFRPPASTPGGGGPGLWSQLDSLRRFFEEIPFWRMHPIAPDRLIAPEGASVRGLEESGKIYALYAHHARIVPNAKPRYQTETPAASRQFSIRLPKGLYMATWWDPRTGKRTEVKPLRVSGAASKADELVTLSSPVYQEDIALIIRDPLTVRLK